MLVFFLSEAQGPNSSGRVLCVGGVGVGAAVCVRARGRLRKEFSGNNSMKFIYYEFETKAHKSTVLWCSGQHGRL